MGELTKDNQVLVGHVIATFTVKSFTECFAHCDEDCSCRSFNLPMSGEGNCELNSADNSTVLMKPKPGWRYHHLQVKEVIAGDVSFVFYLYSTGFRKVFFYRSRDFCIEIIGLFLRIFVLHLFGEFILFELFQILGSGVGIFQSTGLYQL